MIGAIETVIEVDGQQKNRTVLFYCQQEIKRRGV